MSWQTANFSIPIGRGVGQIGFKAAVPGTAGLALVSAGAAADPVFGQIAISTGVSGLGSGVATFLATPTSANLAAAVTNETGSGALVFATSPTLVNPVVGTQTPGNNTTLAASTAFVTAAVVAATAGVSSLNGQTGALFNYFAPQGRLTLASATPVMTASQAAKTTIYYTPYVGSMVPIYDGSNIIPTVFTELSVATSDATKSPAAIGANKVNDWFVWNDGGTIRIGHGPDWTNDTTRSAGTALVMVNGILLNNASITNGPAASRGTYVGTTRSDGSSQLNYVFGASASGGTAGLFNVWNAYNRVVTATTVTDSGAGYSYTTATTRQARASAGNQVTFVCGLSEDGVSANYVVSAHTANALNAQVSVGLGFDSTSAFANGSTNGIYYLANAVSVTYNTITDAQNWLPGIGVHTISANERGDGSNANTFCDNSASRLNVSLMT